MEKKNLKKLALSLSLVGVVGVGATLAALSSVTEHLTNKFTFTSNGLSIKLDEAKVDPTTNKALANDARVPAGQAQTYGTLIPDMVVDKDPTVTVEKDNLPCNVFVSVKNTNGNKLIITDLDDDAWRALTATELEGYGYTAAEGTTYYVYQGVHVDDKLIEDGDSFGVVPTITAEGGQALEDVFEHVKASSGKISGGIDDIVIKAAAYQADLQSDTEVAKLALADLGAIAKQNQE